MLHVDSTGVGCKINQIATKYGCSALDKLCLIYALLPPDFCLGVKYLIVYAMDNSCPTMSSSDF